MPRTLTAAPTTLDTEVFFRLWDREKMTPTLARHLLKLTFSPGDRARMRELAAKNREGEATPREVEELDTFVRVGIVLSIIHSRARKVLRAGARNGRG